MLATAFAACTNENVDNGIEVSSSTISAGMGIQSRTALGSDAQTITWSEGDQIYLFDSEGTSKATFNLQSGAGQRTATFFSSSTVDFSKIDKSLYPVPTVNGNEISFNLPAERDYTENSAAPMIGDFDKSTKHVGFRNLVALVRVNLLGNTVTEGSTVTLTMDGSQIINGKAIVNLEDEKLTFSNGNNSVTIKNIPANTPWVDVPVPAGTYSGYTVKLNNVELKSSTEARTLGKDDALVIGELPKYIALLNPTEEVDYAVLGENRAIFYEFNEGTNLPKRVAIYDGETEIPQIIANFDEFGLPINIQNENFVIVIGQRNGNKFNAYITDKDGNTYLEEGLQLPNGNTWDDYKVLLSTAVSSRAIDYRVIVDATNVILSAVGCASSASAAISTGGVFLPLALINCTGFLLDLGELVGFETHIGVDIANGLLSHYVGYFECFIGQLRDCVMTMIQDIMTLIDLIQDANNDDIQLGNGALISGNGDVKITLTWNKPSDIDLHCVDPSGYHIYYADRHSEGTNGYLDFDNIPGFPTCTDPENIYFAAPAPTGRYEVYLHYFSDINNQGPVTYNVLIMKNGVGKTYRGTISKKGDIVPIETFTIGTQESRAAEMFRPITWDWNNLPAKN